MSEKVRDLKALLDRYLACYRALEALQAQEKEHLSRLEIQHLDAVNTRKETLALEVKVLEESRARMVEAIAAELDVEPRVVNVSYLIENGPAELRPDFERLQGELKSLAEGLGQSTEVNRRLVISSLNTARNMERVLRELVTEKATYMRSGRLDSARGGQRLVERTL